jgi:Rha family phage regulatory protein
VFDIWINARLQQKIGAVVSAADAFDDYRRWVRDECGQDSNMLEGAEFWNRLTAAAVATGGYVKKRKTNGRMVYAGWGIAQDDGAFQSTAPYSSGPIALISDVSGKPCADSREVAERFGKEHKNVLRDIDELISKAPSAAAYFEQGYYELPNTGTQRHRCFTMDRDGFALLAMGFTGTPAVQWKVKYLEAFNAMEHAVKSIATEVDVPTLLEQAAKRYRENEALCERMVDQIHGIEQRNKILVTSRTQDIDRMAELKRDRDYALAKLGAVAKHAYRAIKEVEAGYAKGTGDLFSAIDAENSESNVTLFDPNKDRKK